MNEIAGKAIVLTEVFFKEFLDSFLGFEVFGLSGFKQLFRSSAVKHSY